MDGVGPHTSTESLTVHRSPIQTSVDGGESNGRDQVVLRERATRGTAQDRWCRSAAVEGQKQCLDSRHHVGGKGLIGFDGVDVGR